MFPGKAGQVSQIQTLHFRNMQAHNVPLIVLPLTPPWVFLSMKKLASWEGKWLTKVTDPVQGRTGIQSLDHLTWEHLCLCKITAILEGGLGAEMKAGWRNTVQGRRRVEGHLLFLPVPHYKKPRHSLWARIKRMLPEAVAMRLKSITGLLPLPRWPSDVTSSSTLFRPINSWVHLSLAFC